MLSWSWEVNTHVVPVFYTDKRDCFAKKLNFCQLHDIPHLTIHLNLIHQFCYSSHYSIMVEIKSNWLLRKSSEYTETK